ncbi:MAG: putative zinc-binding metallopeptidase, partial [Planctomycetota bacterium]|nr:putative zinc-binding metallopeptidase [Planctomycetota bacterium]
MPSARTAQRLSLYALAVVLATIVSSPVYASDPKEELAELEKRFGMVVQHEDFKFPFDTPNGKVQGKNAALKDVERYLPLFKKELAKFPKDIFRKLGVKRVVLCTGLAWEKQPRAAVPELCTMTFFLDVRLGRETKNYQERVVHHDFFHFIDWMDDSSYDDSAWKRLNPKGFKYGTGGADMQGGAEDVFSARDDLPGFLTKYSTSGVEEDKAEIYSFLMTNHRFVAGRMEADKIIVEKVRLLKKLLQSCHRAYDAAFWKSIEKATLPEQPEDQEQEEDEEEDETDAG